MDEMVVMESLDQEDQLVPEERKELLDFRDLLDPALEESRKSGGVEPPAPTHQELN